MLQNCFLQPLHYIAFFRYGTFGGPETKILVFFFFFFKEKLMNGTDPNKLDVEIK